MRSPNRSTMKSSDSLADLSKRETFAMLFMQAILSSGGAVHVGSVVDLAEFSVHYADALIEALAREPQQ